MLIIVCILSLAYFPWPGAGAIWTRSGKRSPDIDELREFAGSGDGCESSDNHGRLAFSVTDASLSRSAP